MRFMTIILAIKVFVAWIKINGIRLLIYLGFLPLANKSIDDGVVCLFVCQGNGKNVKQMRILESILSIFDFLDFPIFIVKLECLHTKYCLYYKTAKFISKKKEKLFDLRRKTFGRIDSSSSSSAFQDVLYFRPHKMMFITTEQRSFWPFCLIQTLKAL